VEKTQGGKVPKPAFRPLLGNPTNDAGFPLSHRHDGYGYMNKPKNLKADISLATKSGHFHLLRTIMARRRHGPDAVAPKTRSNFERRWRLLGSQLLAAAFWNILVFSAGIGTEYYPQINLGTLVVVAQFGASKFSERRLILSAQNDSEKRSARCCPPAIPFSGGLLSK